MIAEILILIMAILFLIMSIFLFKGKGSWLIAGYNTLSQDEKNQYDEKKVCKAIGVLCLVCSVMLCIMAYLGYRVDTGIMAESRMSIFGVIFIIVILTTLVIVNRYINVKAKR